MDWEYPSLLLLIFPAIAFLVWVERKSVHPMPEGRKRALLMVRSLTLLLALAALAGPAKIVSSTRRAVVFVLDYSQSLGEEGIQKETAGIKVLRQTLPSGVDVGYVGFGEDARLLKEEDLDLARSKVLLTSSTEHGSQSNYAGALEGAKALFPAGTTRHIVLVGDGHETRGSLEEAARAAAMADIHVHALPVAGARKPDVRLRSLTPSQSRLHEGAALRLTAQVESTLDGSGVLKLFENGVEVDHQNLTLKQGQSPQVTFTTHPRSRNIYKYRAVLEGFAGDTIPSNNEALCLVDVRGRLRLLYLEGDPAEGQSLIQAMEREGIQLELRAPGNLPASVQEFSGYDGIILSDVPAHKLGENAMASIREYVDKLGGGLIMLGGPNSFGTGGYVGTPIEDALPVRLKPPDEEEKQSSALAIVIDRSGSMAGEKLEMAKSAAIATAEVLTRNDYIGVWTFDTQSHPVAPMTRLTTTSAVAGQISGITAGGGTNIYPAMTDARNALQRVRAKIKHMIVLTDGETEGQGYDALASECRAEGITISTVGIGSDAAVGLLQSIASLGGGQYYGTMEAAAIARIFTQDTLLHTGRMIREEAFEPQMVERNPILAGFEKFDPPPLLGYVKTLRKSTAQVPLVTDQGEPLLAHWRFGLGKVTAFTSDAKSRWASLWISRWKDYNRFWSQVLRETARPPQGQGMDLRCEMKGDDAQVSVDVMQDAGTRANDAQVSAEVFYVAAESLGAPMQVLQKLDLRQSGPGLYEASFRPVKAGVYLVRAQSGSQMISAGLINNPGSEVSLGTVNEKLLRDVCQITGGHYLSPGEKLDLEAAQARRYVELWPYLVMAMLGVFLLDIGLRRWEHVRGIFEVVTEKVAQWKPKATDQKLSSPPATSD